jgi:hypothetical protein
VDRRGRLVSSASCIRNSDSARGRARDRPAGRRALRLPRLRSSAGNCTTGRRCVDISNNCIHPPQKDFRAVSDESVRNGSFRDARSFPSAKLLGGPCLLGEQLSSAAPFAFTPPADVRNGGRFPTLMLQYSHCVRSPLEARGVRLSPVSGSYAKSTSVRSRLTDQSRSAISGSTAHRATPGCPKAPSGNIGATSLFSQ